MFNSREEMEKHVTPYKGKLKNIKLALFDCDGILTDCRVFWAGEEVGFNRYFHVSDGYGFKLLQKAGIQVGVITGGNSLGVKKRFSELKIDYLYMGNEDKVDAFEDVLKKANVTKEETLYMGDELFDIPLLKECGFSATTPHAHYTVKEHTHYTTHVKAGNGAAREVINMLLHVKENE